MKQTATTHGAIFLNHTPEVQLSVRFTSRDELLKQLCLRAFGAVPTYTEDKKPIGYYLTNPQALKTPPAPQPIAASTYTAEDILKEIHFKIEEVKGILEQWHNITSDQKAYDRGSLDAYEYLYKVFTKEKE